MEITEIRQKKLAELVATYGSQAKLARACGDVDASFISQLVTGKRNIGEKAARKMEQQLNLQPMYFDILSESVAYRDVLNVDVLVQSIVAVEDAMEIMGQTLTIEEKAILIVERYARNIKAQSKTTGSNSTSLSQNG